MQLIGTKAHGTATSSMGGPLASGVDRQIVLKAHEASDLKNVFRRDEKAECVASRKPSARTHDQSQELFVSRNLALQKAILTWLTIFADRTKDPIGELCIYARTGC
jgi:hypothetical protein